MNVAILKYTPEISDQSFELERLGVDARVTDNTDELLSADKAFLRSEVTAMQ